MKVTNKQNKMTNKKNNIKELINIHNEYAKNKQSICKEILKNLTYWAICFDCGNFLFENIERTKLDGITMHMSNCGACGEHKELVPISDFEYATGKSNIWD
jgi:hypothetical protein